MQLQFDNTQPGIIIQQKIKLQFDILQPGNRNDFAPPRVYILARARAYI